jgi:hypothetical protein
LALGKVAAEGRLVMVTALMTAPMKNSTALT